MAGNIPVSLEVPGATNPGGPLGPLPFTGADALSTLALASFLVVTGLVLLNVRKGAQVSRRVFAGIAISIVFVLGLAAAAPAEEVLVTLQNPTPARVVFVEDVLGNPLETMQFGLSRAKPFRVRVVDSTMTLDGFNVNAAMSHLYLASGSSYDWKTKIVSGNLSLGYAKTALNVLGTSVLLQPVYDAVLSAAAVCGSLGLPICPLPEDLLISDIDGVVQSVDVPVDLPGLPLVPQAGDTGDFTNPHFAGVAAGDPNKPASWTASQIRVMSGALSANMSGVLSNLESLLETEISSLSAGDIVPEEVLAQAIMDAVNSAALPVDIDTTAAALLIDGVSLTLDAVTLDSILGQSGTYISYPILNAEVPEGTPGGEYRGTLVLTFTES